MADVFISYSRKDRPRVARLAAALEAAGYSVWWDMNLTGGAQFSKETGEQLKEAKAVLVAWSKVSVDSMWVADEATVGRTKKNLVPIAIDQVEPPLGFGQIHAIDFSQWTGEADEACFRALNTALAAVLEREPATIAPTGSKPFWARLSARLRGDWRLAAAALVLLALAAGVYLAGDRAPQPDRPYANRIEDNAVAVLPFVNAGGDAADDYLSEGMADELRDQLGRVAGLKVSARASSVVFRDEKHNAREIAARLGVARLIEGSLLKQGSQLRVSVQIIDGRNGFQLWTHSYNRTAADLLAIQQEVAAAVVAEIANKGQTPAPATEDITAYDKLLLARHYEQEVRESQVVDEAKLARAIDLYRAAVAADPSSALARSRLAGALLYAGDADAAEPEIFKALSLDPNLSEVQYTLGSFYFARDLPGVGAAYQRAVELSPNDPDALSEHARHVWSRSFGGIDKVEELYRRALELDPMSLHRYSLLGYFLGVTGQRDKMLALIGEMTARFSGAQAYSVIGQMLELTGDFDLAIAAVKKASGLDPQAEDLKAQIAELYAEIGDFETAARYEPEPGLGQFFWRRDYPHLIDLAEDLAIERPEEAQIWRLLGFAYSVEGDYENAVRVFKLTGLPYRQESESRLGADQDAMVSYAGALAAMGRNDEARAVAAQTASLMQKWLQSGGDEGAWANTLLSCSLAVLGRDEEAMAAFARVDDSPRLPRLPLLKDCTCFKRFAGDERYETVIAAVEKRQAGLRARVAAMDAAPQ